MSQLLAATRFEIIPLKGIESHLHVLPSGSTITVTSSPKFGLERTLSYSELLAGHGFVVVPHLAANQIADRAQLEDAIARLRGIGVQEVFVVGGDGNDGSGRYGSGLALLEAMAELDAGFTRIGVPAYPEGHPLIDDETLLTALKAKQRHAHYFTTQICFDSQAVVAWLRRIRSLGIELSAFIGISGPIQQTKLLELSVRLGVGQSMRYLSKQRGFVSQLLRPWPYRPNKFINGITAELGDDDLGLEAYHMYTFNDLARTAKWYERFLN